MKHNTVPPQSSETLRHSLNEFCHVLGKALLLILKIWNTQEFPGNGEGSDPEVDKENYSKLVKELHDMLKPLGKIFTAILPPFYYLLDIGIDVSYISQYFDYLIIKTYSYHGEWESYHFTAHNAPLYR